MKPKRTGADLADVMMDMPPRAEKRRDLGRSVVTIMIAAAVIVGGLTLMIRPVSVALGDKIETSRAIKEDKWHLSRLAFLGQQQQREQIKTEVGEAVGWTGAGFAAACAVAAALVALGFGLRSIRLGSQARTVQPLPDQAVLIGGRYVVDGRSSYQLRLDAPHEPNARHGRAIAEGSRHKAIPADLIPNERRERR